MSDTDTAKFARGLARAGGGAILFSLPLLMTMEMWQKGYAIPALRLALFIALSLPLLVGLAWLVGFEERHGLLQETADALVAITVGFVVSGSILVLLHVVGTHDSAGAAIGKISLQAMAGAIGALLAQSQLQAGSGDAGKAERRRRRIESSYPAQALTMVVGAVFLSLTVAPTKEIVVLAATMTSWHLLAAALASLIIMHAFVYWLEFRGQHSGGKDERAIDVVLRFTVAGYALALVVAAAFLWLFGRTTGASLEFIVAQTVVLAFPASLGAAAARLIL